MSAVTTTQAPRVSEHAFASPPFLCSTRTGGAQATWIHVAGELDLLTAPQLERALYDAQHNNRVVVVDMREISFIDSAGIHVLLAAHKDAKRGKQQLRIVSNRVVERLLTISGASGKIPTVDLGQTSIAAMHIHPESQKDQSPTAA